MKVASIPLNLPFLDIVARQWIAMIQQRQSDMRQGLIIVPNQRSARALTESFLRVTKGQAILLPRIIPVGEMDEASLAISGYDVLTLRPAVEPIERIAILTRLIMAMERKTSGHTQEDEAWQLGQALADMLDQAEWNDCDLQAQIVHAVTEEDYAEHWKQVLKFLSIVTEAWPNWLIENNRMNPVARRIALLRIQIKNWKEKQPLEPIWAVGFMDARPVITELLATIAELPNGQVVIPDIQEDLADEIWDNLPITHPYSEIAHMLQGINLKRSAIQIWREEQQVSAIPVKRVWALQQALLPAEALEQWQINRKSICLKNVHLLEAIDQQEESAAIALIMRQVLETPGKKVAFVTPDRNLAMRVALELKRWGVIADDSAGEPLAKTPTAVFLGLIIRALNRDFKPTALLSLLKHPLAACGLTLGECRASARWLERTVLRGASPLSGLAGIRYALQRSQYEKEEIDAVDNLEKPEALLLFLDRLEQCLAPLLHQTQPCSLPQWLTLLVQVAEALATTPDEMGSERLWHGEEGNAVAEHLTLMIAHTEILSALSLVALEGLLKASYAGVAVRGRRALRGNVAKELHPRVYIWGLIEARLQSVDTMILGGLSEGIWPPAQDTGPWMSRPMRMRIGLPSPDAELGRTAYDFMLFCCSAPEVILSSSLRHDGVPVVQSRWLVRLKAWLDGRKSHLEKHPALQWASMLDRPLGPPKPVTPPQPQPPLSWRPRTISITDVETWLRDPYAIYAKRILKLKKLSGLEENNENIDFGLIVHQGLRNAYLRPYPEWQKRAVSYLYDCLLSVLEERQDIARSYHQWWRPRLLHIAEWVANHEAQRRVDFTLQQIKVECEGSYLFDAIPDGGFYLRGRADRIDVRSDGKLSVVDYKTGSLNSIGEAEKGYLPQLLLESLIASTGGFGKDIRYPVAEMLYWVLNGRENGNQEKLFGKRSNQKISQEDMEEKIAEMVEACRKQLEDLILTYTTDEKQPYLSHPRLSKSPRYADYAQLARVQEWSNFWGDE